MNHSRRPLFLMVLFASVAGILGSSAASWAQTEDKAAPSEKSQTSSGPRKPMHKPAMVISKDSIVRLADRVSLPPVQPPGAEPATAPAKESSATAEDTRQRKAEIAAVEKQIKDKQQRVELLMRLFVADERSFLKDPLNASEDPATQERRRYEQDELRWETAEVARLRARLDELKAMPER
jgi:hypothetical protein